MSQQIDLVIRGGHIVDGSGSPGYDGDVYVNDGRIVSVGWADFAGREEIDARGQLVTPGFVDVHTHYDGQSLWSSHLTPSSAHGVTTVVMGNCGVGFAPCRAADRDLLVSVMEGVEDIPEAVMADGLPWNWETFPEYLAAVAARPRDIDVAAYLPHSALRVYVMGDRGANREQATEADRDAMRRLTREAIEAGAMGFATSSAPAHRTKDGHPIPTFETDEAELQAIARGIADANRGIYQIVADFDRDEPDAVDATIGLFERLARTAEAKLTFSLVQTNGFSQRWKEALAAVDAANARGVTIVPQVFPRPIGMLLGHELSLDPFRLCPTYQRELAPLPFVERITRLRDPEIRRKLLAERPADPKQPLFRRARMYDRMFPVGAHIDYEPKSSDSIAAQAERRNVSPEEMVYDLLLEDDGRAMLYLAMSNYADGSLDPILAMIRDPNTILGLGDGGAHYGLVCDASFPTFMLSYWARDRQGDRLTLPEAIRALTSAPAAMAGFADRGLLKPGLKADINIIDHHRLELCAPHVEYDLPGGRPRLDQAARGLVATIVSGQAIQRDGRFTGNLPGRLVRSC